jgi:hypothetical protein
MAIGSDAASLLMHRFHSVEKVENARFPWYTLRIVYGRAV